MVLLRFPMRPSMFSIRASISVRDILFQLPESAVKDDLCPKHEKLLQQIYSSCVCERTNFWNRLRTVYTYKKKNKKKIKKKLLLLN
jgi:hypothetical protein